jgi:hypothetical protein
MNKRTNKELRKGEKTEKKWMQLEMLIPQEIITLKTVL